MKKYISLFLALLMMFCFSGHALAIDTEKDKSDTVLCRNDLIDYQKVINDLNKEYGYSMSFSPEVFSKNNTYKNPTKLSIQEFEKELRADIEADIAVNNETKKAVEALGKNVGWEDVPFTGKSYSLPVNATYYNSQIVSEIERDAIDFHDQIENKASSIKASSMTVTSTQPRKDPTGNIAFLLNSKISVTTYWKYGSINSFSYMNIGNGKAKYIPTSMSRKLLDSARTCAVTFTCKYYNSNGVLVNNNSSVYKEFYAAGDCITNYPNYTISKTKTNKIYKHISGFSNAQNCAGYAWNYKSFVDMTSLGITLDQLNKCSNLSSLRSLVKSKSENYMRKHNISANEISAYNSAINPTSQYRVVMRVGYNDSNGNGKWDFSVNPGHDDWDYHWWMQLGDGSWADKRGFFPSRIIPNSNNYQNPGNLLWSMYNLGDCEISRFYNSTPVYYKITG